MAAFAGDLGDLGIKIDGEILSNDLESALSFEYGRHAR